MLWERGKPLAALASAALIYQSKTSNNGNHPNETSREALKRQATEVVRRYMIKAGIPGLSVAVSINGKTVYKGGFGYSDVETLAPCTANTAMRIASISKSITSTIAATLVDQGKLNIDLPIKEYLPDFPKKTVDGKEVNITSRQLMCHMGGIRHYPPEYSH